VELRRHLEQAQTERRTVRLADVTYAGGSLEVEVSPLVGGVANEVLGTTVAFHDVTAYRRLQDELEQATRQLETTNEELQSTVEELETTNEELQSTNEELETMNEELQSTNDELQTINDELRDRTGELDTANAFLEAILTGLQAGVVVLTPELHVRVWSRQAEELWGLRQDEAVGEHFLNLDIGLPTDLLRSLIRRTLGGEEGSAETTVTAVNRRGRSIDVRVLASALWGVADDPAGIILTMERLGEHAVDGRPAR
jgi:two-component system CheB/CheR fusion protein